MNLFELGILDWIQKNFQSDFLDEIMPYITRFGDGGIFWIAVTVLLICFKKTRRIGLSSGAALLIGVIFGNLFLKNIIRRVRPYDLNTAATLLVKRLSDYSFPSGHTLASFEAATAMMVHNKRIGIPALVLAVLIAFSRLYLYVHYPSDVLAGAVLGTVFGIIGCLIVKKSFEYFDKRKKQTTQQ